jgi:hypothetical protein
MAPEMKEHDLVSPVDLPGKPIEGRHPLAWTSTTIAVAAILLLFANAGTLAAWVDEKPVTEMQQQASRVAGDWKAVMRAYGITAPREALHGWWKQLQAARFADEAPGETQ